MILSFIITAHNEGILAHKTILSVFRALEHINDEYEIVVHIDNGTPDTIAYFNRYKTDPRFRIFLNHFGDLGKSRNFAVSQARGEYIIFTDADDLIASNYISSMLNTLKMSNDEIVVHPEYSISFWDDRYLVWHTLPECSHDEMAILLFAHNQWPSSCGAKRSTFVKYPYSPTANGYGHEDYILNIDLTSHGVKHVLAKNTTNFYRQKNVSLMRENDANNVTQPFNELFSFSYWQNIDDSKLLAQEAQPSIKERFKKSYIRARDNKAINAFITPFANIAKKITGKKVIGTAYNDELPQSIIDEWKKVSQIETGIYPSNARLKRTDFYRPNFSLHISSAYKKICQQILSYPDYVFVTSYMLPGGSEKVILNYLKALHEIRPEWKIAVITTLPANNTWKSKLPENAFLIDFGNTTQHNLTDAERQQLFTRLIVQLKTKKIHIVNSLFAYRWIESHAKLVEHELKVYLSLFCHDIIPGTNGEGLFDYADPYAIRIYPLIEKIYTDNQVSAQRLVELNAFDKSKIKVHYQPVDSSDNIPQATQRTSSPKKLRILWASRIAEQKNPELLVRIAKKLEPSIAHIDAYGKIDKSYQGASIKSSPETMSYLGQYDDFSSINTSMYDLFLYTSRIDGIPNVLLEASAAGLPILASAAGGIEDFVHNDETGFVIKDANDEDSYIDKIKYIRQHPEQLDEVCARSKELIQKRHSWTAFKKVVREDFK